MNHHNKIKTTICALLARREYSSAMIEKKLIKKGFKEADISVVLEELVRDGVVSDTRFVESFVHYRQSQGVGPLRIRQELILRGISKEMIEDQITIADNTWFIDVQKVWQKRFRGQVPSGFNERKKQIHFLQYRGFTQEQIDSVFEKLTHNGE